MMPRIVIGMWPLSGDFGRVSLEAVESVIKKCFDHGLYEFDVAPNYGHGFAEMALGHVVGDDRRLKVYTKFGNLPFSGKDFRSAALEQSLEHSLVRLRRDSVQGVFLHNPRADFEGYKDLPELFLRLKASGYAHELGLSGAKGFDYSDYPWSAIDIYQQDFNLLYQNEVDPKREATFFARSCLATGILSGRLSVESVFDSSDHRSGWLKGARLRSLVERTERIKEIAGDSISLPSLARRFVLFNSNVHATILGVKTPEHIDDIVRDLDAGSLPREIVTLLKEAHDNDFGLIDQRHLGF